VEAAEYEALAQVMSAQVPAVERTLEKRMTKVLGIGRVSGRCGWWRKAEGRHGALYG